MTTTDEALRLAEEFCENAPHKIYCMKLDYLDEREYGCTCGLEKALATIRSVRKNEQTGAARAQSSKATSVSMDTQQEPVAWKRESDGALFSFEVYDGLTPLYAAPVRTKDLTDGAIWEILETHPADIITAIRAVIAADRKKNK